MPEGTIYIGTSHCRIRESITENQQVLRPVSKDDSLQFTTHSALRTVIFSGHPLLSYYVIGLHTLQTPITLRLYTTL